MYLTYKNYKTSLLLWNFKQQEGALINVIDLRFLLFVVVVAAESNSTIILTEKGHSLNEVALTFFLFLPRVRGLDHVRTRSLRTGNAKKVCATTDNDTGLSCATFHRQVIRATFHRQGICATFHRQGICATFHRQGICMCNVS